MARLTWNEEGKRYYERGVDQCVLYPKDQGVYKTGVAWDGITNVSQNPSGAEPTPQYANNIKYLNLMSNEEFGATIQAFYYPDEFAICNGMAEVTPGMKIGQQPRKEFGLAYRTRLGNDTKATNYGYKIHLVYGALAAASEVSYETINDSAEAPTMSWEVSTTPVTITGFNPTSHVEIDSTTTDTAKLKALEDILYGTEDKEPRLPLPDEVATIIGRTSVG